MEYGCRSLRRHVLKTAFAVVILGTLGIVAGTGVRPVRDAAAQASPQLPRRAVLASVAADGLQRNTTTGDDGREPEIWLRVTVSVLFADALMKASGAEPIEFYAKFIGKLQLGTIPGRIVRFSPHPENVPACSWTRNYSLNSITMKTRGNDQNTDLLFSLFGPVWTEVLTCHTELEDKIIRYHYSHEWLFRGLIRDLGESAGNDNYLRIPLMEPNQAPLGVPPGCAILGNNFVTDFHEADQEATILLRVALFDRNDVRCDGVE